MNNPAEVHYITLHHVCKYVASTITDGIYYWRSAPRQLVIMTTTLSLYIQLTILTFCMGMLMLTGRQTLVAENQPLGLLSCMLVE